MKTIRILFNVFVAIPVLFVGITLYYAMNPKLIFREEVHVPETIYWNPTHFFPVYFHNSPFISRGDGKYIEHAYHGYWFKNYYCWLFGIFPGDYYPKYIIYNPLK